jgi:hypothetical protein
VPAASRRKAARVIADGGFDGFGSSFMRVSRNAWRPDGYRAASAQTVKRRGEFPAARFGGTGNATGMNV